MHILAVIVGLIFAAIGWYWRLKMLKEAASTAINVAQTAANLPRKWKFQRETKADVVDQLDDARIGGLIFAFVLLTEEDRPISQLALDALELEARRNLRFAAEEIDEVFAYSRWATAKLNPKSYERLIKKVQTLAPRAGDVMQSLVDAIEDQVSPQRFAFARKLIETTFREG